MDGVLWCVCCVDGVLVELSGSVLRLCVGEVLGIRGSGPAALRQ